MKILVIGLGKLGLPIAATIAQSGYIVLGYDSSTPLIDSLNNKTYKSREPGLLDLLNSESKALEFCSKLNLESLQDVDLIFIIVPTPRLPDGSFSNDFVIKAINEIGPLIKSKESKTAICIVSTVMPGSCDGEITETLELVTGQVLGKKIGLSYHPEFIALGSVIENLRYPDFHLLGTSHSWVASLVEPVLASTTAAEVICTKMSLLEAELVKISINNFLTMKIAFANSLLQLADVFKVVNINNVTNAIGMDSRIGSKYLTAGAPYGGPCFPRDTHAMSKLFKDISLPNSLSSVTSELNQDYIKFLINKISNLANKNDVIGVLGISYKLGTPVIDESPGVLIALALINQGLKVNTWDDENAKVPSDLIPSLSLDEILDVCDFFVITRNIQDLSRIKQVLEFRRKRFIDLWDQS